MDLPDDKKQAVLGTSEEKKRLMVRDYLRQTNQMPPKFYIAKFSHVMEAENAKVHTTLTHSHMHINILSAF